MNSFVALACQAYETNKAINVIVIYEIFLALMFLSTSWQGVENDKCIGRRKE